MPVSSAEFVIKPRFSWYLFIILLVCHIVSAISVLMLDFPWPLQIALLVLLVASFGYTLYRIRAVTELRWCQQGWQIKLARQSDWQPVSLMTPTLSSYPLVILNFKSPGRWRPIAVILLPDSASAGNLRQLRLLI